MSAAKRVFVVGGSGFLGQAICRSAIARGWQVVSLSRHGAPTIDASMRGSIGQHFLQTIEWVKGDALKPDTYRAHLNGCSAVVHSVGALMENDYKRYVRLGSSSNTPAERTTYEETNRDTALEVVRTARETESVGAFAYISATDFTPFLDHRYISTKREVEAELMAHMKEMRPVILRPGFMYSGTRPVTLPLAAGFEIFRNLFKKTPVGCVLKDTPLAKAAHVALRREIVANAVINSLEDPNVSGVLSIDDIVRVSTGKQLEH
ncbi:hypothetical protein FBU59_001828 [Linderina macrospora]|uniref:Uncharacterized protein n=1 Tax=Linderina macrospora TaxID=4868 RepID=A0ACC1JD85_9FUNG|nr:hypothetical protein FBU59_001828 [Linderina macrospora]